MGNQYFVQKKNFKLSKKTKKDDVTHIQRERERERERERVSNLQKKQKSPEKVFEQPVLCGGFGL